MKKYDKQKQDKIRQNKRNDFGLAYQTLLGGGSWDDYRETLEQDSVAKDDFEPPTENDILAAWILSKDGQGQFGQGGHLHESNDSWAPKSNWDARGKFDSSKSAFEGAGNSIMSGLNIAGTLGGWAGDFVNASNEREAANEKINAGIDQVASQQFGIGDNAYQMSQYDNMQRAQHTSALDNGAYTTGEGLMNLGKDALSGAMTGLSVGGPWGALIGGVVGLGKAGIQWAVNNANANEQMALNNRKADIANQQNGIKFNDSVTNSQRLQLFNQLQQPYDINYAQNGGKLKKMKNIFDEGGYINSHFDYLTDPLAKVQAGGTHQENPNQGVQTSIAPDGEPNLVEEGETIHNDYVYSDRIVADEEILKSHLLNPKFAGKTYADISKELEQIIQEHNDDEPSKRTFEEMMSRLQQAQEDQKFKEKQAEVEKFINSLSDEEKQTLEEEMVAEAQQEAQAQAEAEQAMQEQAMQEQQVSPEEQAAMEQQYAQQGMAMQQPQQEPIPSRYDDVMSRAQITDAANQGMFGRGGHLHQELNSYAPTGDDDMAQLSADERTWYERNISGPLNAWLLNLPSPEFGQALRTFTPLGLFATNDPGSELMAQGMPVGRGGGNSRNMYNGTRGQKVVRTANRSMSRSAAGAPNAPKAKPNAQPAAKGTESAMRASEKAQAGLDEARRIERQNARRGELWGYNAEAGVGQKPSYPNQVASRPEINAGPRRNVRTPNAFELYPWLKPLIGVTGTAALGTGIYGLITKDNGDIIDKETGEIVGKELPNGQRILTDTTYMQPQDTTFVAPNGQQNTDAATSQSAISTENNSIPTNQRNRTGNTAGTGKAGGNTNNTNQDQNQIEVEQIPDNLKYPVSLGLFGSPTYETDFFLRYNPNLSKYGFGEWNGLASPVVDDGKGNLFVVGKDGLREADKLGFDYQGNSSEEPVGSGTEPTSKDWSTYLRYAPAIGSGIQYLSDLLGVTNRNDYTNPNLFQRSINAIPNVGFTPLGGYRTFRPFDETYQQNALRSMQSAARRAVIDNANGNAGATLAALDALNYNTGNQFGDLALKARQYNDAQQLAVDQYNQRIAEINSTMSLNAQQRNQMIAAEKARLTASLAQMRQQIEDNNDAARSANMTNFYQNVGNVGKENFNMTMVRTNPAFYYTILSDGTIAYKNGYYGLNAADKAIVDSAAEAQAAEQAKKNSKAADRKAGEAGKKPSLLIGGRNPFGMYNFGNY